jgi:hypothetical protein
MSRVTVETVPFKSVVSEEFVTHAVHELRGATETAHHELCSIGRGCS